MIELPVILNNFLEYNVSKVRLPLVIRGFTCLENFSAPSDLPIPSYLDKYMDMINDRDEVDPSMVEDLITRRLDLDLIEIIRKHRITIAESADLPTYHLVDICEALYDLQARDDYDLILRLISTDEPNEFKFAKVLNHTCGIDIVNILDIVCEVDDKFFELLTKLGVNTVEANTEEEIDCDTEGGRLKSIYFFKFLDDYASETLGYELLKLGYADKNMTFDEIDSITPYDLLERALEGKNDSERIINLMSVLMVSKDGRENPSVFFREISDRLGDDDPQFITKAYTLMAQVHKDFIVYLQDLKDKEIIEDGK